MFELVEGVRRRPSTPGATAAARSAGSRELPERSIDDQLHLIRAFGWLSLSPTPPRTSTTSAAAASTGGRIAAAGRQRGCDAGPPGGGGLDAAKIERLVDDLLVVPVITAHPTEVRRQTVLDVLAEVSRLLAARRSRTAVDEADTTDASPCTC